MARPTKYSAAIQKQADEYISGGWRDCDDAVPSVVGLACELGVSPRTLHNWAQEHEQFLRTLDECEARQHRVALSGGLRGDFNAAITKLLLHNHGYSDKAAHEHTGPNGGPVQISRIEIVAGSGDSED